MTGPVSAAQSLMATLVAAGVDVCFANPGTTEMPLVAGARRGRRRSAPVLGLFEGVGTGAADGYGRMAGRPAVTLLHLGPGLANASPTCTTPGEARTPMVNVVGEHATWHRGRGAPLADGHRGASRGRSPGGCARRRAAAACAGDAADAVAAARRRPAAWRR